VTEELGNDGGFHRAHIPNVASRIGNAWPPGHSPDTGGTGPASARL